MKLVDIGYGNMIAAERVIAVCSPDSAPLKRLVSEAKENGEILDVTCGKRTKCVIILDEDTVVLCALPPEKVAERINGKKTEDTNGEEDE